MFRISFIQRLISLLTYYFFQGCQAELTSKMFSCFSLSWFKIGAWHWKWLTEGITHSSTSQTFFFRISINWSPIGFWTSDATSAGLPFGFNAQRLYCVTFDVLWILSRWRSITAGVNFTLPQLAKLTFLCWRAVKHQSNEQTNLTRSIPNFFELIG